MTLSSSRFGATDLILVKDSEAIRPAPFWKGGTHANVLRRAGRMACERRSGRVILVQRTGHLGGGQKAPPLLFLASRTLRGVRAPFVEPPPGADRLDQAERIVKGARTDGVVAAAASRAISTA